MNIDEQIETQEATIETYKEQCKLYEELLARTEDANVLFHTDMKNEE